MPVIKIVEKPTDPMCSRISAGGTKEIGYYLVYRGKKEDIIEIIDRLSQALKEGHEVEIMEEDDL